MPLDSYGLDLARWIDDRVDEGMFRIDRRIYRDRGLYEAEMDLIYERGWVFLCHESQVAEPGDYFATHIGRQPVFVIRRQDGGLACFVNACSHRGAILTPFQQGNARVLTCRFHGWAYDASGKCVKIKNEETGYPKSAFDRSCYDLKAVPHVDIYRGFVFGALGGDIPTLAQHLGEARAFIDLFTDQSPEGLEVVRGSQTYVCDHDWKLQAENVTDGYHVSTVHRNFMTTVLNREAREGYDGLMKTETGRIKGDVSNGCYDLGGGHIVIWADRGSPEAAPLYPMRERIERDFPAGKADWMLRRGRNILVFPNLVLNDLASTHMRAHRPLGPGRCEVTIWCIAPKGEPAEARAARLRKFEDFFLVTGMATSDDVISLDVAQAGSRGRLAGWNEFTRGITEISGDPDPQAEALGIRPAATGASWDHECTYIGFYRHWRKLLEEGAVPSVAAAD